MYLFWTTPLSLHLTNKLPTRSYPCGACSCPTTGDISRHCDTRRFIIIIFTRAQLWTLFWATLVQITSSNSSYLKRILILSRHIYSSFPDGHFFRYFFFFWQTFLSVPILTLLAYSCLYVLLLIVWQEPLGNRKRDHQWKLHNSVCCWFQTKGLGCVWKLKQFVRLSLSCAHHFQPVSALKIGRRSSVHRYCLEMDCWLNHRAACSLSLKLNGPLILWSHRLSVFIRVCEIEVLTAISYLTLWRLTTTIVVVPHR